MTKLFALLAVLVLASSIGWAGEMYRWTDSKGRVHYGDSIPEQYRDSGRKLPKKENLTEKITVKNAKPTPETDAREAAAVSQKDEPSSESQCEKAWRDYRESQECFAPYRVVGGGIKAEAFTHCKDLPQPPLCN